VIASFVYDGDGNRVKATVNGVTTSFVGTYFEWTNGQMTKYYYAAGQRVAMRDNGTLYYLFGDHLGSTSVSYRASDGQTTRQLYKPWGESRYTSGTMPTKYTYTGQYSHVTEFGLLFYVARWYDPALGRFAQADSIVPGAGNPLAWDRYAGMMNNPVKYIDPSGHRTCTAKQAATGDETCDQNMSVEDLEHLLGFLFNWNVVGEWTKNDLLTILDAGKDIRSMIDAQAGKSIGAKWIRSYLGGTVFHHGNLINRLLGNHHTVIWRKDVNLLDNFSDMDVVHELGHIFDNFTGDLIGFPATWEGGGSADGLIRYLGGIPLLPRWLPLGIFNLPNEYRWKQKVDSGYGNIASAEYFAQTFKYFVYDPTQIPGGTGEGSPYYFMQSLIALTVTFLGP
jgi:RHS repeat-associated protein